MLARARAWDRHGRQRLLDGVPLGIKGHDRYRRPADGAGRSEIFPGRQPDADAPVVSQARALGFNVLGKNTVSRHAIMLPGPARNPHDLTRTPAASSAGSAAAVADFMAPLSVGTQTAGSILRPSAFCGAVGFKPTLDAIPYVGIRRYSRPLDVIGPIARSVADAALFMRFHRGSPLRPAIGAARRFPRRRVALKHWADTEPGMREAFDGHLKSLSRAGVQVTELSMPSGFEAMGEAQDVIMAYDLAREYAMLKRDHAALCDPGLIEYLTMGEGISASDTPPRWTRRTPAVARSMMSRATWTRWPCHPRWARRRLPAAPAVLLSSASGPCCTTRRSPCRRHRGPNGLPLGFQLVGFVRKIRACCTGRVAWSASWGPPRTGPEPDSCFAWRACRCAPGISAPAGAFSLARHGLVDVFSYLLGFSL